jgi:hypothetical protein
LGFCCAFLLGACFFASLPFSAARSVICQQAPFCQPVVMVWCLFFNFAEPFGFECCLLAQEMNFLDCYLPYFRQWLITTHCQPACHSSHLFTKSSCRDQLLALTPFSSALSEFLPLQFCATIQFVVYCSGFFFVGMSVCPGGYAGLSQR